MSEDSQPKVDSLFAFLAEDSAGMEHVMEANIGGNSTPLFSRDVGHLMQYKEMAKAGAAQHGLTVRLVAYTARKDIETFKPDEVLPGENPKAKEKGQIAHDKECDLVEGRCAPCISRLMGAIDTMMEYIRISKEQKAKGAICPLCERDVADEAVAKMAETVGDREDSLRDVQTLMALLQEQVGVTEWPQTEKVIAGWAAK